MGVTEAVHQAMQLWSVATAGMNCEGMALAGRLRPGREG